MPRVSTFPPGWEAVTGVTQAGKCIPLSARCRPCLRLLYQGFRSLPIHCPVSQGPKGSHWGGCGQYCQAGTSSARNTCFSTGCLHQRDLLRTPVFMEVEGASAEAGAMSVQAGRIQGPDLPQATTPLYPLPSPMRRSSQVSCGKEESIGLSLQPPAASWAEVHHIHWSHH